MFKQTVQVPFITAETIKNLRAVSPNLSLVVDIPTIDTEDKARVHATTKMSGYLVRYEYIKEITNVTLDAEKNIWNVTFQMFGD